MSKIALPDINQFQDHIRFFIAYLVVNHRPELLKLLKDNGVVINNPTDKELVTAIFVCIRKSKTFRAGLQSLMTRVASTELQLKDLSGKTVEELFGNDKNKTGFSNAIGDPGAGAAAGSISPMGSGLLNDPYKTMQNVTVKTTIPTAKKPFAQTAVGGFLGTLFSKENVNKAVGTGIDLLGQKLSSKANQDQINSAQQLEVARTLALAQQQQTTKQTAKWVVPVAIIAGLAVIAIVVGVIVSHKKK